MPERRPSPTTRRLPGRTAVLCALAPPVVLQVLLPTGLVNVVQLVGMLVAGFLGVAMFRRPDRTVRALIIVLPFQLLLTSTLYELGLGGGVVRMLGLWKEVAVLALGVAAFATASREQRGLDALDRLCAAFVGLGTLYLVLPRLARSGADIGLDDRFLSWRSTVLPVLILVIVRHLRFSGEQVEQILRTLVKVGVTLGGIGLVELLASNFWNHLLVDTLGVNRFRLEVLDLTASALRNQVEDIRTRSVVGGRTIVRAGGPMVGYLEYAFFLLAVLAFQGQRMAQSVERPGRASALALVGFGLVLSQTRSAVLGAGVVAAVALLPVAGRSEKGRARLAVIVAVAVIVVVPLALATGAATRLVSGDSASDSGHALSLSTATEVLGGAPLGNGLGTGAIGANRAGSTLAITSENQFLDVGVQLGVLGLLLFAAVLVAVIVRLGRSAKRAPAGEARIAAFGARAALLGLLVPCWYLQPFLTPEVGWVVFALLGAALGAADRAADERGSDRPPRGLVLGRV